MKCFRCGEWDGERCSCKDGQTIFHGDCLEILPKLPKVDLVLTDPPYGIGLKENGRHGYDWSVLGDENSDIGELILGQFEDERIPQVVFASPKNPWSGKWRQWLVWDKGPAVGGGGDIATCWKFDWELIQVRNTPKLNGNRDTSVIRCHVGQRGSHYHPCQKPVKLLSYLLGKVPAETVLDPFLGSGTTLRACKDLGRRGIGIELEEKYCEIAAERLRQGVLC
jgi:DNA modification methylase